LLVCSRVCIETSRIGSNMIPNLPQWTIHLLHCAGEMIVGPTKALFMDEISNGLDSSTTSQIVSCLQQMAHVTHDTVLISLLQPAPETFDLFDDVILMAEGKIVYHGPRSSICKFFEDCGFRCPERKGVADFLQEVGWQASGFSTYISLYNEAFLLFYHLIQVISRKDQAQYWYCKEQPYSYVSIDEYVKKFKESEFGQKLDEELSKPFAKSESHKTALSFEKYSLPKWELFKVCSTREFLLMKRNYFIYVFKSVLVCCLRFTKVLFTFI